MEKKKATNKQLKKAHAMKESDVQEAVRNEALADLEHKHELSQKGRDELLAIAKHNLEVEQAKEDAETIREQVKRKRKKKASRRKKKSSQRKALVQKKVCVSG